ncbi:MAG: hypothetical protein RML45_03765 [Acetobacteraceae bacterium]|nr:hypothetical protein [Acetobacteraceae bacterium]
MAQLDNARVQPPELGERLVAAPDRIAQGIVRVLTRLLDRCAQRIEMTGEIDRRVHHGGLADGRGRICLKCHEGVANTPGEPGQRGAVLRPPGEGVDRGENGGAQVRSGEVCRGGEEQTPQHGIVGTDHGADADPDPNAVRHGAGQTDALLRRPGLIGRRDVLGCDRQLAVDRGEP